MSPALRRPARPSAPRARLWKPVAVLPSAAARAGASTVGMLSGPPTGKPPTWCSTNLPAFWVGTVASNVHKVNIFGVRHCLSCRTARKKRQLAVPGNLQGGLELLPGPRAMWPLLTDPPSPAAQSGIGRRVESSSRPAAVHTAIMLTTATRALARRALRGSPGAVHARWIGAGRLRSPCMLHDSQPPAPVTRRDVALEGLVEWRLRRDARCGRRRLDKGVAAAARWARSWRAGGPPHPMACTCPIGCTVTARPGIGLFCRHSQPYSRCAPSPHHAHSWAHAHEWPTLVLTTTLWRCLPPAAATAPFHSPRLQGDRAQERWGV